MNRNQIKKVTKLDCRSPIYNIQVVEGVLYFTINLGKKGKQRWKNDGTQSIFVNRI